MYWFRDGSSLALIPWLASFLLTWLGGWLLATHAFKLERGERLVAGLALGIAGYAWLVNLTARWLAPELAFYLPALVVLLAGALLAWRSPRPWLDREDMRAWPWLLAGLALFWLFAVWGRGLAIFDEQKNLSLISIIANGDVPPRFFPNTDILFTYHYGFHLFAASLMRLGGMLPWSAFDTSKAIVWSLTILLGGLLGRRVIGRAWGGWAAGAVLALASGTRYLLLLLPPGILLKADSLIQLQGTSAAMAQPFSQALASGWVIDGGPPFPYMFAFLNGILQPLVMAHQGPNTFAVLLLILLWLLLPRLSGRGAIALIVVVLSIWALTWETAYALFMVGLVGFAALYFWQHRNLDLPHFKSVLVAAAISIPVVLLQGGTFTEMARSLFAEPTVSAAATASLVPLLSAPQPAATMVGDLLGFSLRWPPAILSSHLGALSVFSPIQLLVGLFEIGPVLLFTPWITRWAWRRAAAGDWQYGVLAVAAWVGFLMPMLLEYSADRDISRLSSQALLIWTLMLLFLVADTAHRWQPWLRQAGVAALVLVSVGGLVVAATQFSAASVVKLGDGFNELDSGISAQIWGTLSEYDIVFGPLGATTILTGHLTGQLLNEARPGTTWQELSDAPSLASLRSAGYDFLYIDSRWWDDFSPEVLAAAGLDAACVTTLAEVWDNSHVNYRRFLDLRSC